MTRHPRRLDPVEAPLVLTRRSFAGTLNFAGTRFRRHAISMVGSGDNGKNETLLDSKRSKATDVTKFFGEENGMVRSIVLMSTLATAADVVHGMSERKQGRDPSSQEDPVLAGRLVREAAVELEDHLLSLRAARILRENGDVSPSVALSRRMNEVMILSYLARLLKVMHQRMLSLYPEVSEELLEEARLLHAESTALRDKASASISPFVARVQDFCNRLRLET